MVSPDIIGSIAACLTTAAFVPQVIKTVKSRHTRDISLLMWLLFNAGVLLWLIYGLLIGAWPVILANGVTLILALIMLLMKLKNLRADRHAP